MIHRIVIMTFKPEMVETFMEVFDASKFHIRNFPGCCGLKLLKTTNKTGQLSTFSLWESEEALNNYRNSALFIETWAKTKILFSEKPVAFSTVVLRELDVL